MNKVNVLYKRCIPLTDELQVNN